MLKIIKQHPTHNKFIKKLFRFVDIELIPNDGDNKNVVIDHNKNFQNQFLIIPEKTPFPSKWIKFFVKIESKQHIPSIILRFDIGNEFQDGGIRTIPLSTSNDIDIILNFPVNIEKIRLELPHGINEFQIEKISFQRLNFFQFLIEKSLKMTKEFKSGGEFLVNIKKSYRLWKAGGWRALVEKIKNNQADLYQIWIKSFETLTTQDIKKIKSHIETFQIQPKISIIMPVYNTPEMWLREAIESILNQIYENWELCVVDDASPSNAIKQILSEYANDDSRIKIIFREKNGHISAASNSALKICTGEYIALVDHDDKLPIHSLYMMINEINQHPTADLIYSDEDKINESNIRFDPYFKPDWNPDLFNSQNYICHLGLYRTKLVREVGGFREGFEGAQDWDLAMRIIEIIPPENIRHLPFILYHWRSIPGSTARNQSEKDYIFKAQYETLISHFSRINQKAEIIQTNTGYWKIKYELPNPKPLVSIIIPTKNQRQLLEKCINSIFTNTLYDNYELIVIDNLSDDPKTLEFLSSLREKGNVKILNYMKPFNFSAINNYGVQYAEGEIIVFLNNDIEIINPNWLDEMVMHAVRPEIGAVGAKLYYPNGLIQHAGVILGLGGVAGHAYQNHEKNYPGQMGRALLVQNFSAVTAACMALRKEVFLEVGGFNAEKLPIAFNDVDFCLRVLQSGYRNLWTPFAELVHHESVSRGYEDTPEKQARFVSEIEYMKHVWIDMLELDQAYNPNLSLESEAFTFSFLPRIEKPWG